jgi:hypothetical protein
MFAKNLCHAQKHENGKVTLIIDASTVFDMLTMWDVSIKILARVENYFFSRVINNLLGRWKFFTSSYSHESSTCSRSLPFYIMLPHALEKSIFGPALKSRVRKYSQESNETRKKNPRIE